MRITTTFLVGISLPGKWFRGMTFIAAALIATGESYGQSGTRESAGERQRKQLVAPVTSSNQLRQQTVVRDRTVNNGFGVQPVQAPSAATPSAAAPTPAPAFRGPASINPNVNPFANNLVAPARRESASFGVGVGGPASKPFSGVSSGPTVSPYLNLFRNDFGEASDLNYQTLVRPELQQRAFNQQIDRQTTALNQRLMSISARNPYNARGAENVTPTGHPAAFQYYSRFYPGKQRAAPRR